MYFSYIASSSFSRMEKKPFPAVIQATSYPCFLYVWGVTRLPLCTRRGIPTYDEPRKKHYCSDEHYHRKGDSNSHKDTCLSMLPVRLRHAADHLSEDEDPVKLIALYWIPWRIRLVI